MPRVGPISRRDFIRCFRLLGFDGPYAGSRHQVMVRGDVHVPIPNPHEGDISRNLLVRILREAGIRREEWEAV